MAAGPNFVKIHIASLMSVWRQTFAKPTKEQVAKYTGNDSSGGLEFWMQGLVSREAALSALFAFILNNHEICSLEICKKLIPIIANCLSCLSSTPSSITKANAHVTCLYEQIGVSISEYPLGNLSSTSVGASTPVPSSISTESLTLLALSIYPSISSHFLLYKKRIFQVCEALFTQCGHSPYLYEPVHVHLLRTVMDSISGDVTTGPTTNDVNKLLSVYSVDHDLDLNGM
jgi:hypothetical protein